ncbi:MAG: ROK family protein [Elusimicrobia bacterium]|nr:ROK family protein [Elusimicrobiota bacterium]
MKKKSQVLVGMDCGGTNVKFAIVTPEGQLLDSKLTAVDYKEPAEKVIKKISLVFKNFIKQSAFKKIKGIGIGIAGDVDQKKGLVRFSPNLGWNNVNLSNLLSKEIPYPLLIENDANCAAWGAWWLDAKKDCKNLICLTLGTGIGGGIILNSKLYRGATGSAGEIGHMTIRYDGQPCRCGNFGCAESFVGAWGLIREAESGLKRELAPILKKILKGPPQKKIEPKSIAEAAKAGDPFCRQLWQDTGERLGSILSNCVNIFNPERIVLCGGVSKAGSLLLEPALHTLGRRAFAIPAKKVKVTVSQYDENLGVVGAALLFLEK